MGPGYELFDYIATCLHTFMEGHGLEGKSLPLGFTFSFPLVQVPFRNFVANFELQQIKIKILTTWFFLPTNWRIYKLRCAAKITQYLVQVFSVIRKVWLQDVSLTGPKASNAQMLR